MNSDIEIEEVINRLIKDRFPDTSAAPSFSDQLDKALKSKEKVLKLQRDNDFLTMREERKKEHNKIKEDFNLKLKDLSESFDDKLKESIKNLVQEQKDKTNWGIEILKLTITLLGCLGAMKYLSIQGIR